MLIEAMALLAAAATAQVFRLAGQLVEEGQLSPTVLPRLHVIDEVFSEMGQDSGLDRWTQAAMSADVGWDRARQPAREVLAAEGEGDAPLPSICVIR
ncbi:hypothetical protein [Streptomyces sp. NPDC096033]|uniref:hypothetical protein n=1 Tax=Streptomyces sp. NPDC096033 TaxID=3366071 RepID=UPI003812A38C